MLCCKRTTWAFYSPLSLQSPSSTPPGSPRHLPRLEMTRHSQVCRFLSVFVPFFIMHIIDTVNNVSWTDAATASQVTVKYVEVAQAAKCESRQKLDLNLVWHATFFVDICCQLLQASIHNFKPLKVSFIFFF